MDALGPGWVHSCMKGIFCGLHYTKPLSGMESAVGLCPAVVPNGKLLRTGVFEPSLQYILRKSGIYFFCGYS